MVKYSVNTVQREIIYYDEKKELISIWLVVVEVNGGSVDFVFEPYVKTSVT